MNLDDEDEGGGPMLETMTAADAATSCSTRSTGITTTRQHAKQELLDALNASKGDSTTPAFCLALENLLVHYQASHFDPHVSSSTNRRIRDSGSSPSIGRNWHFGQQTNLSGLHWIQCPRRSPLQVRDHVLWYVMYYVVCGMCASVLSCSLLFC